MRRLGLGAVVGRIAKFPFWGAIQGAGVPRVEKGAVLKKRWRHNVGLCRVTGTGEGRGSNSRRRMGRQGVGLGVWRNPTKKGKKLMWCWCKFRKLAEERC